MAPTPSFHPAFLQHLTAPAWVGEMDDADWIGEAGSLGQGEYVRLFARADGDRLAEVRFMAMGCSATLAASAALAERLQGRTLTEADAVGSGDVAAALGGLEQDQAHGAHLAITALRALVAEARGEAPPPSDERIVCTCYRVSESMLRHAIKVGDLTSVGQISAVTMAGRGCHTCHADLRRLIAESRPAKPVYVPPPRPAALSLQEKVARVMDRLDDLQPRLAAAGASARVVDATADKVILHLSGQPSAEGNRDLRRWLEHELRQAAGSEIVVEEAS